MLALNCFFPYLVMRMDFKVLNICTRRLDYYSAVFFFAFLTFRCMRYEMLYQKKKRSKFQNIKTTPTLHTTRPDKNKKKKQKMTVFFRYLLVQRKCWASCSLSFFLNACIQIYKSIIVCALGVSIFSLLHFYLAKRTFQVRLPASQSSI